MLLFMITFLLCSLIVVSRLQPGLCLHIIPGRLGSDFNYAYGVYTDGDSLDEKEEEDKEEKEQSSALGSLGLKPKPAV
mgnify:CR=1 FL=1